jgi:hypothetical protein
MADTLARNLVPAFFVLASSSSTMSAVRSRDALAVSLTVLVANCPGRDAPRHRLHSEQHKPI